MKKNTMVLVAAACAYSTALQAVHQERLEKFLALSDNVALIQNCTHVGTAALAWPDRWFSSQNIEDMAYLTLISQIPNDVVRVALERNRSWWIEISQQAVLARSFESVQDAAGVCGAKLLDTVLYNKINQIIHAKYPALDDQVKRRVLRVVCMTIVRLAIFALAHGIIERTKPQADFWGVVMDEQDERHGTANFIFGVVVAHHVLTECAGAVLFHRINDAIV